LFLKAVMDADAPITPANNQVICRSTQSAAATNDCLGAAAEIEQARHRALEFSMARLRFCNCAYAANFIIEDETEQIDGVYACSGHDAAARSFAIPTPCGTLDIVAWLQRPLGLGADNSTQMPIVY
jgi:hypothetical protein